MFTKTLLHQVTGRQWWAVAACWLLLSCLAVPLQAAVAQPTPADTVSDGRMPAAHHNTQQLPAPTPAPTAAQPLTDDQRYAYGILSYDYVDSFFSDGLIRFPLEGAGTFDHVDMLVDGTHYITAAAYAKGYYYVVRNHMDELNNEVPVDMIKYDLLQRTIDTVGVVTGFDRHLNDMTFDYSTSTLYAITRPYGGNSALFTIDLNTAESQKVCDLDRSFFTLACNYGGQLYGISFDGDLCSIDKTTGAVNVIGATGLYPNYNQSMEFDHSTGTLYWAACLNATYGVPNCMATLDLTTGEATRLNNMGSMAQVVGLYIPFSASASGTPAAVTQLTLTPAAKGEKRVTLRWTNPTTTFDKQALTQLKSINIYRNNVLIATLTDGIKVGETMTYDDVISDDQAGARYAYAVAACLEEGEGALAEANAFVGKDVPQSPTNLTLTSPHYDDVELTWSLPTEGKEGGYVDTTTLTWQVTKQPGNEVVATLPAEQTTYSEAHITPTQNYTYTVQARNAEGSSAAASTPATVLGPIYSIPYVCDFTAASTLDAWTISNAYPDDGGWEWSKNSRGRMMGHRPCLYHEADDWLISYFMPFKASTCYRVDYDYHAYGADNLEFELQLGGKTLQSLHLAEITHNNADQHGTFVFEAEQTGNFSLAIHAASPFRADWIELFNVEVREAERMNLTALSLSGNTKPMVGKPSNYSVMVRNVGATTVAEYDVMLKSETGETLSQTHVTKPLQPGDDAKVEITWTPTSQSVTKLYAEVQCPGDEVAADNCTTDSLAIVVSEAFNGDVVSIGADSETLSNSAPFDFFNLHGAALNIYSADEVMRDSGYVTKVGYFFDTMSQYQDVENAPVKVYMANTELTDTKGGWIPQEELTLVYDGTINLPKGQADELTINLQRAFAYSGGNLAVFTTVDVDTYNSYVYFKQYTSPLANNAAFLWGSYYDATGFDFTQRGHVDWYNRNTSIRLYLTDEVDPELLGIHTLPTTTTNLPYEVYDLMGRKVATGTSSADNANALRGLPAGIYVVRSFTDGQPSTRKVRID